MPNISFGSLLYTIDVDHAVQTYYDILNAQRQYSVNSLASKTLRKSSY
jgi:hypothetical protein